MKCRNFLRLAKDLWNTCKQYGNVVDAYIPNTRSKAGNRFGFVRFIKIFDVERLVKNLCTVWVGCQKLHANVARFLREPLTKKSSQFNTYGDNRHNIGVDVKNRRVKGYSSSYAHIVK
ncbi:nucleotide-binding alpha-beta plait domain-containing protein, partial [Tanacetum coccineum]